MGQDPAADLRLAQGWVEGSTENDWDDVPQPIRDKILSAALSLKQWHDSKRQNIDELLPIITESPSGALHYRPFIDEVLVYMDGRWYRKRVR